MHYIYFEMQYAHNKMQNKWCVVDIQKRTFNSIYDGNFSYTSTWVKRRVSSLHPVCQCKWAENTYMSIKGGLDTKVVFI